jgi:hypothetical protein
LTFPRKLTVFIFRAKIGNGSTLIMEAVLSAERQITKGKAARCQNSENSNFSSPQTPKYKEPG